MFMFTSDAGTGSSLCASEISGHALSTKRRGPHSKSSSSLANWSSLKYLHKHRTVPIRIFLMLVWHWLYLAH